MESANASIYALAQMSPQAAEDASVKGVQSQIQQLDIANPIVRERVTSPFGLGYVFGFVAKFLIFSGLTGELMTTGFLGRAYARLFTKAHAEKLIERSLQLEADREFGNGFRLGEKEAEKFAVDPNCSPRGLSRHASPWR